MATEVERIDFVSVPTRDPDGNVLILHRRYAPQRSARA
jgi:hypothetical protein